MGLDSPDRFWNFMAEWRLFVLQRNIRIACILTRLWHRDGKKTNLRHLPRVRAIFVLTLFHYVNIDH